MYNKTGGARPLGLLFEEKARRCAKKIERVTAPLGGGWDEGDQAPMDGLESESYSSSAFGPSSACVQPPTSMAKFNLVWLLLLFTCKILGESERRKQCIKIDFKCEACNKRMCDECYIEHHK